MSRGGGRGGGSGAQPNRNTRTFTLESMNLSRETLPLPTLQPPAAFPARLSSQPLNLCQSDQYEQLLEIKRDFQSCFRMSRFHDSSRDDRRIVDRYSDRYTRTLDPADSGKWDFDIFPSELQESTVKLGKKKKKKPVLKVVCPEPLSKLPADEGEEKATDDKDSEKESDGEEEGEPQLEEEEMGEEETDYALTYFDNGEDYLDADNDDNGDEGPTY